MLVVFLWIFAVLSIINVFLVINSVGKPREPITRFTAGFVVFFDVLMATVLINAATALG